MKTKTASSFLLLLLALFVFSGAQRRVSITDELDDVVDDEEDEEWKQWGLKKSKREEEHKPPDFSKMSLEEIQAEIARSQTGPSFGFVKLRPDVSRSREDVPVIAMKWSKVLRIGSIDAKFMAVDRNTIMFTMEKGQDTEEPTVTTQGIIYPSEYTLKEFVLSQSEAYEMKIGNQLYRRPGDPPLDEVVETLNRKKGGDGDIKEPQYSRDEL